MPPALQETTAGESLFNDGAGVVVFTILLTAALAGHEITASHAAVAFLTRDGVLLGLAIGWIAFRAMRSVGEYNFEVLIRIAWSWAAIAWRAGST